MVARSNCARALDPPRVNTVRTNNKNDLFIKCNLRMKKYLLCLSKKTINEIAVPEI
jgi:hypothetical protein